MATRQEKQPEALSPELLVQKSGAAVAVSHSGAFDAPAETLWASAPPADNRIEVVSAVANDQKDYATVVDRLAKQAEEQAQAEPLAPADEKDNA